MYITHEFNYSVNPLKDDLIRYPFDFRGLYSSNYAFGTRITTEETMEVFEQIKKQFPKDKIDSLYTDRLTGWDGDYKGAIKKATGEDWGTGAFGNMSMNQIDIFLKEYINKKCECLAVIPFVNASNGYPLWLLIYKTK